MRIGPFEIVSELGRGGAGIVYLARSHEGTEVAIKVLVAAGSAQAAARFERERRLLATLGEEKGFVPLHDVGTTTNGPYLVMPFLSGGTLRTRLKRGALGVEATLELGKALAKALGEAHALGIVHRDLKPENVLFTADGRPLIADLGVAKHFRDDVPGADLSGSLTRDDGLRGTVGYMSPEQVKDPRAVGPAADVFALGAMLYECLSGHPAFEGATVLEVLARTCEANPRPLASEDAPPWLAAVVRRALARDPEERFADGHALARALAEEREAARVSMRSVAIVLVLGAISVGIALAIGRRPAPAPPAARTVSSFLEEAREFRRKKDRAGALVLVARALELDPRSARALAARGQLRGDAGDLRGAIADLTQSIEIDPTSLFPFLARGCFRANLDESAGAMQDFTRAIELDPKDGEPYAHRGMVRARQGDRAGARADLDRAIELSPKLGAAYGYRAQLEIDDDDLEGAVRDATRAIELDPTFDQAWAARGLARARLDDAANAIADMTRAFELGPLTAPRLRVRARARARTGDFAGAIDDVSKLLELEPGDHQDWLARSTWRFESGDPEGSAADATRALELKPDAVEAHVFRARARDRLNDVAGAIADLERVLELAPKHEQAAIISQQILRLRSRLR